MVASFFSLLVSSRWSSILRARSTMRASRCVSMLSVMPTPEIRNTGPSASWISLATFSVCRSICMGRTVCHSAVDPGHGRDVYSVYMSTRDRLVSCALEELEKGGVEALSLRSVSAAAGVTPMAVYRHFPNKDELLQAAGREAFAEWHARALTLKTADPL